MKKAKLLSVVLLVGAMIMVSAARAEDAVSLDGIIKAVKANEAKLQDSKIEYTRVLKQYNTVSGKELTPEEQQIKDQYPGYYLPEEGVLQIKGKKIKLERNAYDVKTTDKKSNHVLAYDGDLTRSQNMKDKTGVVSEGRSHRFRTYFNPLLTYSATGDMDLSEELLKMDAKIVPGLQAVDKKMCQVIKLYLKNEGPKTLRTFKVYLDPAQNYAMVKVERFWYEFAYLESVMEVKETVQGEPLKSTLVTYKPIHKEKTSIPYWHEELTVNRSNAQAANVDDDFQVTYNDGVIVWDEVIKANIKIGDSKTEDVIQPQM